jgi:hypothetical protein
MTTQADIDLYKSQLDQFLNGKFVDQSLLLGFNTVVQSKFQNRIISDFNAYFESMETEKTIPNNQLGIEFNTIALFDSLWSNFHYKIIKFFSKCHSNLYNEILREYEESKKRNDGKVEEVNKTKNPKRKENKGKESKSTTKTSFKVRPVEIRKLNDNFLKFIKQIHSFYSNLLKYFTTHFNNLLIPQSFKDFYQLYPQNASISTSNSNVQANLLFIIHKCLICLGNLSRHRSFIDVSYVQPSISNKNFFKFKFLSDKQKVTAFKPYYKVALQYYKHCILLIPALNEPYNHIGMIYNLIDDKFNSCFWFLKSQFTRIPNYRLGESNLMVVLNKKWFLTNLVNTLEARERDEARVEKGQRVKVLQEFEEEREPAIAEGNGENIVIDEEEKQVIEEDKEDKVEKIEITEDKQVTIEGDKKVLNTEEKPVDIRPDVLKSDTQNSNAFSLDEQLNILLINLVGFFYLPNLYKRGPNIVKHYQFVKVEIEFHKMMSKSFESLLLISDENSFNFFLKHFSLLFSFHKLIESSSDEESLAKFTKFTFRYVEKFVENCTTANMTPEIESSILMNLRLVFSWIKDNKLVLKAFHYREWMMKGFTKLFNKLIEKYSIVPATDGKADISLTLSSQTSKICELLKSKSRPTRNYYFLEDVLFKDFSIILYQFKDFKDDHLFQNVNPDLLANDYTSCLDEFGIPNFLDNEKFAKLNENSSKDIVSVEILKYENDLRFQSCLLMIFILIKNNYYNLSFNFEKCKFEEKARTDKYGLVIHIKDSQETPWKENSKVKEAPRTFRNFSGDRSEEPNKVFGHDKTKAIVAGKPWNQPLYGNTPSKILQRKSNDIEKPKILLSKKSTSVEIENTVDGVKVNVPSSLEEIESAIFNHNNEMRHKVKPEEQVINSSTDIQESQEEYKHEGYKEDILEPQNEEWKNISDNIKDDKLESVSSNTFNPPANSNETFIDHNSNQYPQYYSNVPTQMISPYPQYATAPTKFSHDGLPMHYYQQMAYHQGYPFDQGMPQNFPQRMPVGMPPGMPQGIPQGIPQGMPQGIPQGMPQGMPQGNPAQFPPQGNPAHFPLQGPPQFPPQGPPQGLHQGMQEIVPQGVPQGIRQNIHQAPMDGQFHPFAQYYPQGNTPMRESPQPRSGTNTPKDKQTPPTSYPQYL